MKEVHSMSEVVSHDSELNGVPERIVAGVSPGALMRDAREAAGVHVDTLAAALKISVDRLEALEADQYAALPDMVFARALASSACRILKIDPTDVLALMPKNQVQALPVSRSHINATFKDGSEKRGRHHFFRQFTRPLSLAVVALLVGAGVLFFLPGLGERSATGTAAPVAALAVPEISEKVALTQPIPDVPVLDGRAPLVPDVSVAADVSVGSASDISSLDAAATGTPALATDGVLEFRAREATWVQVRDATKAVVFERILSKGASASASGILPLSVVIGRADSTDVFVRGVPFVLMPVARENVARFEVK